MINLTKKTFFKRSAAFLTALLLITSTGCSKTHTADNNGTSDNKNSGGNTSAKGLNLSFDHSYGSDKIDVEGVEYFNTISEFDGKLLLQGYDDKYQPQTYLYHLEDNSSEQVNLIYPTTLEENVDYYINTSFVNAQNQPVFIYHSSIYDEENEEMPYQDLGFTMEIYDTDFHLLETKDLREVFPEDTYFQSIISDKNGNYYVAVQDNMTGAQKLVIYDQDFKQTGEVTGNIQYVQQMVLDNQGNLIVNYQDSEWNPCFGKIAPGSTSIEQIKIEGMPQWFSASCPGKKDYDLFITDSTSVYGVKISEGICEEVVNWVNSDFNGDNINTIVQLTDGRFVIVNSDYSQNTYSAETWILHERDPKEFENVQMISLATLWMPSELSKAVSQFNRTNSDYRIAVMNYNQYNTDEDYELGLKRFEDDMTSGIVADIICMSNMPYERYVNKGLLLDLTDYVNQLNPDDYFMNFFDSLKYGDKLYRMGFSYNIYTLEAKTEHVNGKSGLSVAEFTDLMKNLPEGMEAFSDMTKLGALSNFASSLLTNFIDLNTASCTFNSPEFIEILELCNTYPDESALNQTENWNDENWDAYWAEQDYNYINDKILFNIDYISNVKQYLQDKVYRFDTADVTFVGYPTNIEGSNGGRFYPDYTISISANSAFKDQIWDFCKTILDEEAQENLSWFLPVRKEAFDKTAAKALKPDTYIDKDGKEVEAPYTVWRGGESIEVPLPTQADVDQIKNYIENIKESMYYNEQVYNIIDEEAQAYFSGEKTAQAAAEMIQSRVSLYLAEQIG